MAAFQRRSGSWRALVRRRGVVDSGTFATKAQAQAWATQREAEIAAAAGAGPSAKHTLHQALERYAEEVSPAKRGGRWELIRIEALKRDLADRPLAELTSEHLGAWRDARLKGARERKPVLASSVNRELNLIASVIACAWRSATPRASRSRR